MERHPELEEMLREKFRAFGRREMPESNLRQADVPEGARYITPERGTAPGLVAELPAGGADLRGAGRPRGDGRDDGGDDPAGARVARRAPAWSAPGCSGAPGSVSRRSPSGSTTSSPRSTNPTIAFLASSGEVKVRITAKAGTAEEADALIEPVAEEVRRRLGDEVFTSEDETLEQAVVRLLAARARRSPVPSRSPAGEWGPASRACRVRPTSSSGPRSSTRIEAKAGVLGVSQETLAVPGR